MVGGFLGANPQNITNIARTDEGSFIITPECEISSPAYKFRMDVDVINLTSKVIEVSLLIDWQEIKYHYLRNVLYVCTDNCGHNWKNYMGQTTGEGRYRFAIPIFPGRTKISASPRYLNSDVASLKAFCNKKPGILVSEHSAPSFIEPVWAFYLKKRPGEKRPLLLTVARCHPYETAGSFCLDGVVRGAALSSSYRERLLERFDLCLIPLLATNGVAVGYCQMNGVGSPGIDVSREWSESDALCHVIKEVVKGYTIAGYLELHNWMHPDRDGIKYANRWFTWKYLNQMQMLGAETKRFRPCFRRGLFSSKAFGIMRWIKETSGAVCLALEYPWHNRTCSQMSELGMKSVLAFTKVL